MEELYNKVLLKFWSKNINDIEGTQKIFDHRAKMCTLAAQGKWSKNFEKNKKKFIYLNFTK